MTKADHILQLEDALRQVLKRLKAEHPDTDDEVVA